MILDCIWPESTKLPEDAKREACNKHCRRFIIAVHIRAADVAKKSSSVEGYPTSIFAAFRDPQPEANTTFRYVGACNPPAAVTEELSEGKVKENAYDMIVVVDYGLQAGPFSNGAVVRAQDLQAFCGPLGS